MDTTGQHWPVWTSGHAYLGEPASRFPARAVRRIATLERNSPRLVKTPTGRALTSPTSASRRYLPSTGHIPRSTQTGLSARQAAATQ